MSALTYPLTAPIAARRVETRRRSRRHAAFGLLPRLRQPGQPLRPWATALSFDAHLRPASAGAHHAGYEAGAWVTVARLHARHMA